MGTKRSGLATAPFLIPVLVLSACSRAAGQPSPLSGTSQTLTVRGQYVGVEALDRVERVSIDNGRLVLRGSTTVTVELPPSADPTMPVRHWALLTETDLGRMRAINFTHDESLDEFTIELPASMAPLRFGVFAGRDGAEVMVFAWGDNSRCYWGYVTIARRK